MPIRMDIEQNTEEWREWRCGRPTASQFFRIITPSQMKYSAQAEAYQNQLIGEMMVGQAENTKITYEMELGKILEAEAVKQFEFINSVKTQRAGFWLRDDKRCGASPDRLIVNTNDLLEVKCVFSINDQMKYLFSENDEKEKDHWPQAQGQLWITDKERCRRWMFHEKLPPSEKVIYRDEPFIKKLAEHMERFLDELNTKVEIAIQRGWIEIKKDAVNA